jgi:hypothetical protein
MAAAVPALPPDVLVERYAALQAIAARVQQLAEASPEPFGETAQFVQIVRDMNKGIQHVLKVISTEELLHLMPIISDAIMRSVEQLRPQYAIYRQSLLSVFQTPSRSESALHWELVSQYIIASTQITLPMKELAVVLVAGGDPLFDMAGPDEGASDALHNVATLFDHSGVACYNMGKMVRNTTLEKLLDSLFLLQPHGAVFPPISKASLEANVPQLLEGFKTLRQEVRAFFEQPPLMEGGRRRHKSKRTFSRRHKSKRAFLRRTHRS